MRVALATVGTTGDIAPLALLARSLAERGHTVTAISWPVHRSALAQPGVRVEVAGPHADAGRIAAVAAEAADRNPIEQVAVLRDFHLADGEAHYRRLRTLLADHDLVVIHAIHALAHAAVLDLGVRWATAVFDPVLLPTRSAPPPGMPRLGPLNPLAWWMLDRALARTAGPLEALLPRAGSAQRSVPLFRAQSPLLHLVACSPSVIAVPPDLPPGTHVTGAWLDRSPPAPLDPAVEAFVGVQPRPIVGVSSPNLLRVGPLDHRALFPRASAIVHHGGAGTTHAACAAGVPSVVVPHVGDQRYWGTRLHRLGVAPRPLPIGGALRSDRLADAALTSATDPAIRARAAALADAMAHEDGLATAVSLIEAAV